jgi:hypothetical protein
MYAFTSNYDVVLGPGTNTFGTIDGVKCDAAGKCGFVVPQDADKEIYNRLVQMPYDNKWLREGNLGDHIGSMGWTFSQHVLAPLVVTKIETARSIKASPALAPAKGQASPTAARRDSGLASSQKNVPSGQSAAPAPAPKPQSRTP